VTNNFNSGVVLPALLGGQSFTNVPLPNNRLALYTLSIRAPGQTKSAVLSYTFPISPQAITREYTSMTAVYDVKGSAGQGGVSRVIDEYGNSPPTWSIEGTTGWQFHATDGLTTSGLESIAKLQNLLQQYAIYNQAQADNNVADLYTLEFYDYFANEYWQVEPFGRQGISQVSNQPLIFRYSFRWAGIRALNAAVNDNTKSLLSALLSGDAQQVSTALQSSLKRVISAYLPVTVGSAAALA